MFMRLEDGATLLIEASWAAHRADGDQFGITLYGTEGGAELIVDDYAPSGSLRIFTDDGGVAVATRLTSEPGRGHAAVVEQFVQRDPDRPPARARRRRRGRARARRGRVLPVGRRAARGPPGRGQVMGVAARCAGMRRPTLQRPLVATSEMLSTS